MQRRGGTPGVLVALQGAEPLLDEGRQVVPALDAQQQALHAQAGVRVDRRGCRRRGRRRPTRIASRASRASRLQLLRPAGARADPRRPPAPRPPPRRPPTRALLGQRLGGLQAVTLVGEEQREVGALLDQQPARPRPVASSSLRAPGARRRWAVASAEHLRHVAVVGLDHRPPGSACGSGSPGGPPGGPGAVPRGRSRLDGEQLLEEPAAQAGSAVSAAARSCTSCRATTVRPCSTASSRAEPPVPRRRGRRPASPGLSRAARIGRDLQAVAPALRVDEAAQHLRDALRRSPPGARPPGRRPPAGAAA